MSFEFWNDPVHTQFQISRDLHACVQQVIPHDEIAILNSINLIKHKNDILTFGPTPFIHSVRSREICMRVCSKSFLMMKLRFYTQFIELNIKMLF